MGREALAVCRWKDQVGEIKALLEPDEIILRGDVRARISRSCITNIRTAGDTLHLDAGEIPLVLMLGIAEAAKWADMLSRPPRTLAQKLGVDESRKAYICGQVDDAALTTALKGATTDSAEDASVLIAVIASQSDLLSAFEITITLPRRMIWCVYQKGKTAFLGDASIRAFLRDNGYIDNKTCAVSQRLTATRFGPLHR